MDIATLKRRKTPHDHGVNALSYFSVVRLNDDHEGNARFMCLRCGEIWTVPKGNRFPNGYWVCSLCSCNEDFQADVADPQMALWALFEFSQKLTNEADLFEILTYFQDHLYETTPPWWFEWKKDLGDLLELIDAARIKPNVFSTELIKNAMRHYVAHLAKWFEDLKAQPKRKPTKRPWPSAKEVGQGVMKHPDGSERHATLYEVPLGELLNITH